MSDPDGNVLAVLDMKDGSSWLEQLPAAGPFVIDVPEAELVDLNERLAVTRWPSDAPDEGWRYGAGMADVRRLVWNDLGLGGYFIAAERPDLIAANLRCLMP